MSSTRRRHLNDSDLAYGENPYGDPDTVEYWETSSAAEWSDIFDTIEDDEVEDLES